MRAQLGRRDRRDEGGSRSALLPDLARALDLALRLGCRLAVSQGSGRRLLGLDKHTNQLVCSHLGSSRAAKTMDLIHESKAKFLDAALHVIRSRGYSATRIEDVCDAAGLTKGSFFHHFDSKEDLALAAADHFAAMANRIFASAPYQELPDPLDRLLGYVDFRIAISRASCRTSPACSARWSKKRTTPIQLFAPLAIRTSARTQRPWRETSLKQRRATRPTHPGQPRASAFSPRPSSRGHSFLRKRSTGPKSPPTVSGICAGTSRPNSDPTTTTREHDHG